MLGIAFFSKNVTLKRKLARLAYNKVNKMSLPENTGPQVDREVERQVCLSKVTSFHPVMPP